MTKTKIVSISSVFPASPEQIWSQLVKVETLQYIAAPYASFRPVNSDESMTWQKGAVSRFYLRIFGFISAGVHEIRVKEFNKTTYTIQTVESNKTVPVWKHKIVLKPIDTLSTCYTDEVELYAGWLTCIVYLWSKMFYRHRQRKWLQLL